MDRSPRIGHQTTRRLGPSRLAAAIEPTLRRLKPEDHLSALSILTEVHPERGRIFQWVRGFTYFFLGGLQSIRQTTCIWETI